MSTYTILPENLTNQIYNILAYPALSILLGNPNITILYIDEIVSVDCLSFYYAKTTEPISTLILHKTAYKPESGIGLFPSQYLFSFQDGGPFRDITTCQIGTFIAKITML